MPALASRSLWEQATPPIGTSVAPYTITGVAEPLWGTIGSSVNLALFVQTTPAIASPNNPGYYTGVDLVSPSLVLTLPDKSQVVLTATSIPAIVHTAGTGQYNLYLNRNFAGRYGYSWVQAGVVVFSGEFFASPNP